MAISSRSQLKAWFQRGLKPLESQFASWIDSFWHKDDAIPMSSVDGLTDALNQRTISIDAALSDTSENPVQNKVVKAALDGKADVSHDHPEYDDRYASKEHTHTYDAALNPSSTNAVQNKVLVEELAKKMNTFGRDTDAIKDNRKSFIYRTSAGTQSISDGDAKLTELFGNVENGVPFSATSFRSVKFNLFNPENVLTGYKLNSNGTIEAASGHTLAIIHVLPAVVAAGSNNGYRVRSKTDKTCTINRVGYTAAYPTAESVATVLPATTLSDTAARQVYAPTNAGYLIVDVTTSQIDNLLVHFAWSYDPTDKNEDYSESVLNIPAIHSWGMGKALDAMDEINLLDQVSTTRVDRVLLSSLTWVEEETEIHEDPEDPESEVTSITYKYKSTGLASLIKASTLNLDYYGLDDDFTLSVDAEGTVIIETGEERLLNPAEEFAGIYLYYELAVTVINPVTMELLYSVGDFGTEEFVGTTVAPYYATFFYLTNNEDTLRNLSITQENSRSYTIDFHENRTVVQERNIQCDLAITKIVTDNVATLKVSRNGGAVQTLSLSSGKWEGTLNVNEGDLLVWQITRSTENAIAEINIKYEY